MFETFGKGNQLVPSTKD